MMIKVRKIQIYSTILSPFLFWLIFRAIIWWVSFLNALSIVNLMSKFSNKDAFLSAGKNTRVVLFLFALISLDVNISLNQTLLIFLLDVKQTYLDDSIDSRNVSMTGYLPVHWKYCYSCAWFYNLDQSPSGFR